MSEKIIALAAVAHPDDIEFMMAGTLLLLKDAGAEIHYWNLANGSCGSVRHSRGEIMAIRRQEALAAAALAGATPHAPLFDDLQIFYDAPSLARVAAVVRQIKPNVILTQASDDYMEDHQNAARLITTAAFARGMKNFATQPAQPIFETPVALYHALPHGLRDGLRQPVAAHFYVDIASVQERKKSMLALHRSQKEWLDRSQGMDAYLHEMEAMGRSVGELSGRFAIAEGWRRHAHLGLAAEDYDPIPTLLTSRCHAP